MGRLGVKLRGLRVHVCAGSVRVHGYDGWMLRFTALLALVLFSVPLLAQDPAAGLKAKDWKERKAAVEFLRGGAHEKAERLLIGALKDDDWEVREAAIRALGTLVGSEKALDALVDEALEAPVARMRVWRSLIRSRPSRPC